MVMNAMTRVQQMEIKFEKRVLEPDEVWTLIQRSEVLLCKDY